MAIKGILKKESSAIAEAPASSYGNINNHLDS